MLRSLQEIKKLIRKIGAPGSKVPPEQESRTRRF